MLTGNLLVPSIDVGNDIAATLSRRSEWLRRRIDTVEFVDDASLVRQSTIDVDSRILKAMQPSVGIHPEFVVAPLMMLRKQLLIDCDLRDSDGDSLHIGTRKCDTFLSWSYFNSIALKNGIEVSSRPAIQNHVHSIIHSFPLGKPQDPTYEQAAWVNDRSAWTHDDWTMWTQILQDFDTCSTLLTLTYSFLLITYLPVTSEISIIKFSSRQDLPNPHERWYERFPLRTGLPLLRMRIPMPAADHAQSSHLRILAPSGVELHRLRIRKLRKPAKDYGRASAFFTRAWRGWKEGFESMWSRVPGRAKSEQQKYREARDLISSAGERCQTILTPDRAHVYIESAMTGLFEARVSMHVPRSGFIRAALVAAALVFATLLAGLFQLSDLANSGSGTTDAAVAILLLAPSAFAAYLVRYGEHALVAKLLMPIRAALLVSMGSSFVAASGVVLYGPWQSSREEAVWDWCTGAAGLVLVFVLRAYLHITREERGVRRDKMTTQETPIVDVEEVEARGDYTW